MRSLVRGAAAVAGLFVIAEAADAWPRRAATPAGGGRVAIVVLGFPGHTPVGRAVQRWRVRMAARAREHHPDATVVLTGGVTFGAVSEAAQMAVAASANGIPAEAIVLEECATSTWENVMFSHPLVAGADRVVVVSDGVHAARARRSWLRQFPDDADRVVVDPAFRPFEATWIKLASAIGHLVPALSSAVARRRSERSR